MEPTSEIVPPLQDLKTYLTMADVLKDIVKDCDPLGNILNFQHEAYDSYPEFRSIPPPFDELARLVNQFNGKVPFCIGATMKPSKDCHDLQHATFLVQSLEEKDCWEDLGCLTKLPVEKLLQHCVPAPFGDLKKMETVLDPAIRKAFEMPATNFKFSFEYTEPEAKRQCYGNQWSGAKNKQHNKLVLLEGIQREVSNCLLGGREVNLVPYKLNVYGEGGFFKQHVDTPVDSERMVGTVVVCLPSLHEGGELVVTHGGVEHVFDFSKQSGKEVVQFAALFSDCVHEVRPVRSGHRITLTYSILLCTSSEEGECDGYFSDWWPHDSVQSPSSSKMISDAVEKFVSIVEEKVPQDGTIGIFLNHKYTIAGLNFSSLKAGDRILGEALHMKWPACKIMPVVLHQHSITFVPESDEICKEDLVASVYAFSNEDFQFLAGHLSSPPEHGLEDVPFLMGDEKGQLLKVESENGAESTGNGCAMGYFDALYFHSVIVVQKSQSNVKP